MAFPGIHVIEGLTTNPSLNSDTSGSFLPSEILKESLILMSSLEPMEIASLSKRETSVIASALNDYKNNSNSRFKNPPTEQATGRRPNGEIKHINNRILGIPVQHYNTTSMGAVALSSATLLAIFWTSTAGLFSIVGRSIVPAVASLGGIGLSYHSNNRTLSINQLAAHLKNLADNFNSAHDALVAFSQKAKLKKHNFKPSKDTEPTFAGEVISKNPIPAAHRERMSYILNQFTFTEYQRVELIGDSANFVKLFFNQNEQLTLTKIEYGYLTAMDIP
ncbi:MULTISPECIES: hypothetical protein [Pantoea]|jgi:hypothetical protein|uniref:Uncharacterized protein n=2 Tax=Pantoea ananas TaxID=553 RepID=D4GHU5_PANAM|nr:MULTISPECIES: hypothetical protein [Pantoea]ADD77612.1 Hypothetical Protein PANA_2445 [Pantoea ananatis LMG 20103]AER32109.1 hypothetical protein PAGR_g1585 [Pantoea ananatis PA13]AMB76339.1 hypothetical protein AW734_17000 [Pantoea ananatis]ASN14673.1 hypothetical protein B7764_05540 [Pantoea ananatis]AVG77497.1 hypothetical protein B9Q16_16355 [Pantoea ananatis]